MEVYVNVKRIINGFVVSNKLRGNFTQITLCKYLLHLHTASKTDT